MVLLKDKIRKFLLRTQNITKEKGFSAVLAAGVQRIRRNANINFWYFYNRTFRSRETFLFEGKQYRYFFHKYNLTWRNERAIEIPIVKGILQQTQGDILEVGNVLSHYFNIKHDVVDKYERGKGVMTKDVIELRTSKRYDLIISISTLEHVGWDESPYHTGFEEDSEKILKALHVLRSLLKPQGKIVVTVPLGYNPHLNSLLKSGKIKFDRQLFMKRVPRGGRWIEATWDQVQDMGFNMQVPTAKALLIGIIES